MLIPVRWIRFRPIVQWHGGNAGRFCIARTRRHARAADHRLPLARRRHAAATAALRPGLATRPLAAGFTDDESDARLDLHRKRDLPKRQRQNRRFCRVRGVWPFPFRFSKGKDRTFEPTAIPPLGRCLRVGSEFYFLGLLRPR